MSLLMDALRKAEQEKKEAAKRLQEQSSQTGQTETGGSPNELTLVAEEKSEQPVSDAQINKQQPGAEAGEAAGDAESRADSVTRRMDSSKVSLSLLDKDDSGNIETKPPALRDDDNEQASADTDLGDDTQEGDTTGPEAVEAVILTSESRTPDGPDESLSQTGENKDPGPELSISPLDEYEDTLRDTIQDARLTPTVAGTIDGDTHPPRGYSPAAAQSVFAARKKHTNYTLHTAVVVIVLAVVAAIAYGVVAYYAVTPVVPDLPSPTVARGVEQVDAPPAVPAEPVRTFDPAETVALIEPAIRPAELPDTTAVIETTEAEPDVTGEPVADMTVSDAAAAEADTPTTAVAAVPATDAEDMLELKPALLRISRSEVAEDRSGRAVNDAYLAYRQGRYDTAGALYGVVLAENPDHRDALLGMAAIELRSGRYERAFDYYMQLLKLNPADRVAQSAVIGLQTQADPLTSESRIRSLLEDAPDAPYLHFTLGNLYASQSRWPDAQQAFFDAFRLDSGNADYAHNLAVSLDRLGQPRAARDYYRRALELAGTTDASFDTSQVSFRLQALTTALDSQ